MRARATYLPLSMSSLSSCLQDRLSLSLHLAGLNLNTTAQWKGTQWRKKKRDQQHQTFSHLLLDPIQSFWVSVKLLCSQASKPDSKQASFQTFTTSLVHPIAVFARRPVSQGPQRRVQQTIQPDRSAESSYLLWPARAARRGSSRSRRCPSWWLPGELW